MKKTIIIFITFFLINIININYGNANNDELFKKYKENIKFCDKYKENNIVYKQEDFKNADEYKKDTEIIDVFSRTSREEKAIKKAMYTYKENMNNTYKCGMISIQINSLKMLKPKLNLDKTGHIGKSLGPKIDNMIQRLEMTAKSGKCELIDKKTIYNKKSILGQTTLATCKYTFYMQYLKEYYSDTRNVVTPPSEIENENIPQELKQNAINVSSLEAGKKMSSIQSDIDTELENAYKVFPIAFHAYSEYENNYPIHFLLELIKEDYMVFRDELHKMINPISQVGYKIVNAMKK